MRNDDEVDGVGVVELRRVADDLLQFHRQPPQLEVLNRRRQHRQVVVEARHGVDGKLRRLQRFLRSLPQTAELYFF